MAFIQSFRSATPNRQILLVTGLLLVIFSALVIVYFVLRTPYQVLFTNLRSQDAATIVAELERQKLPFKLDHEGTTVLVPESDVHAMRLKVMSQDLPLKGTVGFELFNSADLGLTEFAQKVNYQRALQGELARTIMSLESIQTARVHLALPESSLFRRTSGKPKASVALVPRETADLNADTIRGIQRLVAAAVPELEPADVTIVDQRGAMANKNLQTAMVDDPKLEMKVALESYYTRKIQEAIEPIVGAGKVGVSVDATINFDQIKTTQETTDARAPANSSVRNENTTSQIDHSLAESPSGLVDGISKNSGITSRVSSDGRERSVRKLEQIVSSPGTIRRLSVGVILKAPVDSSTKILLNDLVAASIGLSNARGDTLSIFVNDGSASSPVNQIATTSSASMVTANPPATGYKTESLKFETNSKVAGFDSRLVLAFGVLLVVLSGMLLWMLRRKENTKRLLTSKEREEYVVRLKSLLAEGDGFETAKP